MTTNNVINLQLVSASTAFTPAFAGSSVNPTSITYAAQNGYYIQFGNIIHISLTLKLTAITLGGAAGNLEITGLPFTSVNNTQESWTFPVSLTDIAGIGTYNTLCGLVTPNSSIMTLFGSKASGAGLVPVTDLNATSVFTASGFYAIG